MPLNSHHLVARTLGQRAPCRNPCLPASPKATELQGWLETVRDLAEVVGSVAAGTSAHLPETVGSLGP